MKPRKLITASVLERHGVNCNPVITPVFIENYSTPGVDTARCLYHNRFESEEMAVSFMKEQPEPRFVWDVTQKWAEEHDYIDPNGEGVVIRWCAGLKPNID